MYTIPKDPESSVNGTCGNINGTSEQYILIIWSDNNAQNALNMSFKLNHTTNEFTLNKIAFDLDKTIFPIDANLSSYSYYYVGSTFATPKQNSYHCTRPQALNLTNSESSTDVVGTVSLSHTLLEAYHEGKSKTFSTAIDCDAINTPGIFPIENEHLKNVFLNSSTYLHSRYSPNRCWNSIDCSGDYCSHCIRDWSSTLTSPWLCQHVNVNFCPS